MKKCIIIIKLLLGISLTIQAQSRIGIVTDSLGQRLSKVSVTDLSSGTTVVSDGKGEFPLSPKGGEVKLKHIAFQEKIVDFGVGQDTLRFILAIGDQQLDAIEVFSTGYGSVPKERATGSFAELGQQDLNKRVTSSILDNMEGLAPGLQFDRRRSGMPEINIRGINTLSPEMMGPLIVVDNFPFSGDINSLNPLDIESVTLLKDAAAASIWGARAGNGVIVIKTKSAKAGQLRAEGSFNLRFEDKTDLSYYPVMSSSDFIDVERMLFEKGAYDAFRSPDIAKRYVFSPAVELLYKHQEGEISAADMEKTLNKYSKLDYRKDITDHFLQRPLLQQYQIGISGGGESVNQRLSLSFSKQLHNKIGNDQQKINMSWNTRLSPIRNLDILTGLLYTYVQNRSGGAMDFPFSVGGGKSNLYPYAQLVGPQGEALAIPRLYNFGYVDTVSAPGMKDWRYRPLEEIGTNRANGVGQFLNANLALKYSVSDNLAVEGLYNIELNHTKNNNLRHAESFFVRDFYNRFGYIADDQFRSHIPDGGILDASFSDVRSQRARIQVSFDRSFGLHGLSVFAGGEFSDQLMNSSSSRYYGYSDMMTTQAVDLLRSFPVYDGLGGNSTIPDMASLGQSRNRFVSFYANGAYNFGNRYVVTASARRDASNLFGVKTNERWNPLWSTGILWNVHEEEFLSDIQWLDMFKLKGTYGHSGNAGGVASTLPVIGYVNPPSSALYRIKRARIQTLPNESLRWEDVAMLNIGTELSLLQRRLNFSFEYFFKSSTDLISDDPLDPTSGFTSIKRNVAEVKGRGFDMQIHTRNIERNIRWETVMMLSKSTNRVDKFFGTEASSLQYVSYTGQNLMPVAGKMLYPVLSYKFAGLDPETGDPRGWSNGEISNDYSAMLRDSLGALVYHGTGLPIYHGSLQNTVSYKNFEIWVNVAFKFGHFFQRETIRYHDLFNLWVGHSDYAKRWISPGDEHNTSVPSMAYPANTNRDDFYSFSEANIDRGDLVRLQDLRFSYNYVPNKSRKVKGITVFLTASHLGILWKSTASTLDPDYIEIPQRRSYALGLKLSM